MDYIFDDIDICECIGEFEEEYVYDIEMDDETHTFIASDILVHNSLYISYENLLSTIAGYDKMSLEEICDFLVKFNTGFMDDHNKELMEEYFNSRHATSVHKFELETVASSGVWLDVKKRYAQILMWKDGKMYDTNNLPMKIRGLEIIKSSVPRMARDLLKKITRQLLEETNDDMLIHKLNQTMQQAKQEFFSAPLEEICGSIRVKRYKEYMVDDTNPNGIVVKSKCPWNVKALGNYNNIRIVNNLPGEPIYGGQVKWYIYYKGGKVDEKYKSYFAFQSMNYPKWADKYAPISKEAMFQQHMLDPFNRILETIGLKTLNIDGYISLNLFNI